MPKAFFTRSDEMELHCPVCMSQSGVFFSKMQVTSQWKSYHCEKCGGGFELRFQGRELEHAEVRPNGQQLIKTLVLLMQRRQNGLHLYVVNQSSFILEKNEDYQSAFERQKKRDKLEYEHYSCLNNVLGRATMEGMVANPSANFIYLDTQRLPKDVTEDRFETRSGYAFPDEPGAWREVFPKVDFLGVR